MKPNVWREFRTKVALIEAVQNVVNPQPMNVPFQSDLISNLIAERHYFCAPRQIRPLWFLKSAADIPYRFLGHFPEHVTTNGGWHPVSWRKSIVPPSREDLLRQALRNRADPAMRAYRDHHPICEFCKQNPSEETHHAQPTFKQLVAATFAELTPAEFDAAWLTWDWFNIHRFDFWDHSPIAVVFDRHAASARLMAVCKRCHLILS